MSPLPRLAITVGDPAGIGPEVVLRALATADLPAAELTVYGSLEVLEERARRFGLAPPSALPVQFVDVPVNGEFRTGVPSAAAGHAAARSVLYAARAALGGELDGIVTGPLNKESLSLAGYPWPGHTEMLAETAGAQDVAMAFVGGGLRVVLLTIHRSLRSVPDAITEDEVRRVLRLVHRELPRLGAPGRRIALCGLNPHAGEGGLFGNEEEEVLRPAADAVRAEGIDVTGPLAADTLFVKAARGEFDAVVANYHDQGLIPVKMAAFGQAVNVTLGLPFVRTSVDHGTGFDIVDQGVADPGSLLAALRLATVLSLR